MRCEGQIVTWKDDKGFGFVVTDGSQQKVFVHINDFANRSRRPIEGDKISYDITLDQQQREKAVNIRYSNEKVVAKKASIKTNIGNICIIVFSAILLGLYGLGKIPVSVLLIYFVLGVITFIR